MKKLTALLLTFVLVFSFAACSNHTESKKETKASSKLQTTSDVSTETESENTISITGKTLVVYFSASGNTENAANYIAKATNADVFEIEPKDAYTDADLDWTDDDSCVNYEHDNESARNIELVSSSVENWVSYDTVFIGYPIWWGIAAWPVDTFVKSNDFTGKTVIPFCTSASSGLGESGELLEKMAGTGNWIEGERFSERVTESDVADWVNSLDI